MKTKRLSWDPEKVSQLEKLFAKNQRNLSLADRHQIGRILADLKPGYGEAGGHWLDSLKKQVSNWPYEGWSTPNKFLKFVDEYPKFDPKLFAGVNWAHMDKLLRVEDTSIRQRLLMQLRDKKWSVRELQEQIQEHVGTPPARNRDRNKRVPMDPVPLLREFRSTVQHLNRICTAWTSAESPILHRIKAERVADHSSLPSERELATQINNLSKCAANALAMLKAVEDWLYPPETKQLPNKGD